MKSSDYIVDFLVSKGVRHIFGYQGTMIAHFVDSICRNDMIENHVCYNEQGAGFAAVGSAKATGSFAVAYATSGPGAANLISAVADAYYDSTPVLFITGQLNTYEYLNIDGLRQNGFQEMDVVSAMQAVTKYSVKIENKDDLRYAFEKAYYMANEGRPGPVLIDLPMDMQRQEIDPSAMKGFDPTNEPELGNASECAAAQAEPLEAARLILQALDASEAPLILLGNGIIKNSKAHRLIVKFAEERRIPIITSMLGRDLLPYDHDLNYGHIGGGYGHRYANIIAYKKADLIVSLGCSMCKRQTAMRTEKFAERAQIIRVEIDPKELARKVHQNEIGLLCDCNEVINRLAELGDEASSNNEIVIHKNWADRCSIIRDKLAEFDENCELRMPNKYIEAISECIDDNASICADVGQHQVWVSQSFRVKDGQDLLFSGGHGAMGFALPAAIGAHYGTGKKTVAICGDGAFQMNIQELQWVARENVPITMIVMNNASLGLIRQQQDDIFGGQYSGSGASGGYTTPDFAAVGQAYKINSVQVTSISELREALNSMDSDAPRLIEVLLDSKTGAYPKTYFGEEMYNQRPYIPDALMDEILSM